MSKYYKLVKNTLAFAIGNFGSKLLQFILLPYYTRALSTGDYGTIDVVVQTVNILVPLISLCIFDGVLRFAMDKAVRPKDVLRTGFRFVLFSLAACVLIVFLIPSLRAFENKEFILLIIICQSLRTLLAQYIRAKGLIKLYSLSGIVQTLVLVVSTVVHLSVLGLGVKGYLLSLALADVISMVILFLGSGLLKDLLTSVFDKKLLITMLRYSVPLVPNTIMWWGMNASNRYFLVHFHGVDVNGLYAVAAKIPSVLTMLMTIFNQAWQLSAIEEYDSEDSGKYCSNIYSVMESFLYLSSVALVIFLKPFWLSIGGEYQDALFLVPAITASVIFSSISAYFGSLYIAAKKTKDILLTTIYGAIIGLALNYFLIPKLAGLGAGISATISFLFVSAYRYWNVSKYIKVKIGLKQSCLNSLSLLISFGIIYFENVVCSIVCAIVAVCLVLYTNKGNMVQIFNSIKSFKKKKHSVN